MAAARKAGEDPISRLRNKKAPSKPQQRRRRAQPPWFNKDVEVLWKAKKDACRRSQRYKDDKQLKEAAKAASRAFEKAASHEKERLYEEFSRTVTEDRTLHKFWQLHKAMNGNQSQKEIPDFRREDDIWVRTPEEKGSAFLERYLRQTDQDNEEERGLLVRRLQHHYEEELATPHANIEADTLSRVIKQATDSAPGPDGVKYSDLKTLNEEEMQTLSDMLNRSLAEQEIPEEWLDSHLAPVPKPDKDRTSIKGYRIVTMQNTVGKLLEKIVAKRLANQLEEDSLLPSTLGSYRSGKDT